VVPQKERIAAAKRGKKRRHGEKIGTAEKGETDRPS
jgi:hypothetical protein